LEGGVNLSVSVHEELYQTHRAGVGINVRASMRISQKTELGIRGEYDYRFVRNISPDTTGTAIGRALHKTLAYLLLNQMYNLTLRETGFRC
jgi:tetrahydromethanopterin S-methyltransferase subunit E